MSKPKELVEELERLEATKNGGRGVSCVRDIIMFLQLDRIEDARAICNWDRDKIRSYQDIARLLVDEGLMELGRFSTDKVIV